MPGGAVSRLLATAVLLAIAIAAGPAWALPAEKDRWLQVDTANFTFYSDASEGRTLEIAMGLERFRAVLGEFFQISRMSSPRPTRIFMFRNDAEFQPYKPSAGGSPANVAGFFLSQEDANYVAMRADPGQNPLQIIYHEFVHYVLDNNMTSIPAWFNEGAAECYSTFKADDKSAEIGLPMDSNRRRIDPHEMLPLRDLFSITPQTREYHDEWRMEIFYAESWVVTHYLLWGNPQRRGEITIFLDRLAKGDGLDDAFKTAFRTTYDGLQEEVTQYLGRGRFPYVVATFKDLKVDTAARTIPLSRPDLLYHLGDLLAHVAHDDPERAGEIEAHFREALRLDASHAASHAGLGSLDAAQHRTADAQAEYEKALTLNPNDATTCYLYARFLLQHLEPVPAQAGPPAEGVPPAVQRARELLGRVIEKQPTFAEAYIQDGLSYFYSNGSGAEGIAMLEKARRMLPARMDVVTNLISLHLNAGDRRKAGELADYVLSRANDPDRLQEARRLLAVWDAAHAPTSVSTGSPGTNPTDAAPRPLAPPPDAGAAPVSESTPDETPAPDPDRATSIAAYNRDVASYNAAVERAQSRDYRGAITRLERLLKETKFPDISSQAKTLLGRLKKEAARH